MVTTAVRLGVQGSVVWSAALSPAAGPAALCVVLGRGSAADIVVGIAVGLAWSVFAAARPPALLRRDLTAPRMPVVLGPAPAAPASAGAA